MLTVEVTGRAIKLKVAVAKSEELAQIEEYRMPHLIYDENGQVVGTIWEQEAAEAAS